MQIMVIERRGRLHLIGGDPQRLQRGRAVEQSLRAWPGGGEQGDRLHRWQWESRAGVSEICFGWILRWY